MKSFNFLKVYIFEDLLTFEYLILEIYGNITFKLITKYYFPFWF